VKYSIDEMNTMRRLISSILIRESMAGCEPKPGELAHRSFSSDPASKKKVEMLLRTYMQNGTTVQELLQASGEIGD
jgi:hypothetical protein